MPGCTSNCAADAARFAAEWTWLKTLFPTWPDLINGVFEFGISIPLAKSVLMLRKDREVKGFYWPVIVWTSMWGLWNLFYYPHLGQWASFWGGLIVVSVNLTWLAHVAWYSHVRRNSQSCMVP